MRAGYYRDLEKNAKEHSERIKRLWAEGKMWKERRKVCCVDGCDTISNAKGMCDMHYQRMRRLQKKAQFRGNSNSINHRVLHVREIILDEAIPVYDISVPGNENFALNAGVFVHNSKDLADAVAWVVHNIVSNTPMWAASLRVEGATATTTQGQKEAIRKVRMIEMQARILGKQDEIHNRMVQEGIENL
jgi:hypothetical protein